MDSTSSRRTTGWTTKTSSSPHLIVRQAGTGYDFLNSHSLLKPRFPHKSTPSHIHDSFHLSRLPLVPECPKYLRLPGFGTRNFLLPEYPPSSPHDPCSPLDLDSGPHLKHTEESPSNRGVPLPSPVTGLHGVVRS